PPSLLSTFMTCLPSNPQATAPTRLAPASIHPPRPPQLPSDVRLTPPAARAPRAAFCPQRREPGRGFPPSRRGGLRAGKPRRDSRRKGGDGSAWETLLSQITINCLNHLRSRPHIVSVDANCTTGIVILRIGVARGIAAASILRPAIHEMGKQFPNTPQL